MSEFCFKTNQKHRIIFDFWGKRFTFVMYLIGGIFGIILYAALGMYRNLRNDF